MIHGQKPYMNGKYNRHRFGRLERSKLILSDKWQEKNRKLRAGKGSDHDRFKHLTQKQPSHYRQFNLPDTAWQVNYPPAPFLRDRHSPDSNFNLWPDMNRMQDVLYNSFCWLNALASELGTRDHQMTLRVSNAVLQALRDRMPAHMAVEFSRPLPVLLRGFYFKDWHPARHPVVIREKSEFLQFIRDKNHEYAWKDFPDARDVIITLRAVFKVLTYFTNPRWLHEMELSLNYDLRELIHSPRYNYRR